MTSANSFIARMPAGIPGNLTRVQVAKTEPQLLDTTNYPLAFGLPVIIDATSHGVRGITAGDTRVDGFYVRPYPQQGNGTDGLGTSTPPTAGLCDILRSGYMTAHLGGSAAAVKEGVIYVRVSNASSGKVVGDIEAAADVTVTSPAIVGTGTGTIAATVGNAALIVAGTYVLTLQTTSNTSKVTVIDPNGKRLADATVGTAYSQEGLNFTITAAGTMTAGDSFSPVVTANTFALGERSYFTGPADASGNVEIAFNI